MLSLTDPASVNEALGDLDLDVDLRALLVLRAWQLYAEQGWANSPGVRLFAVQGGDTPEVINNALGFPITGGTARAPAFNWILDHGFWFEIAYAPDDAAPMRIFVENGPGTELGIHYLCLSHQWTDGLEPRS